MRFLKVGSRKEFKRILLSIFFVLLGIFGIVASTATHWIALKVIGLLSPLKGLILVFMVFVPEVEAL